MYISSIYCFLHEINCVNCVMCVERFKLLRSFFCTYAAKAMNDARVARVIQPDESRMSSFCKCFRVVPRFLCFPGFWCCRDFVFFLLLLPSFFVPLVFPTWILFFISTMSFVAMS